MHLNQQLLRNQNFQVLRFTLHLATSANRDLLLFLMEMFVYQYVTPPPKYILLKIFKNVASFPKKTFALGVVFPLRFPSFKKILLSHFPVIHFRLKVMLGVIMNKCLPRYLHSVYRYQQKLKQEAKRAGSDAIAFTTGTEISSKFPFSFF